MYHLILAIISIVLFSAMSVAFIKYSPVSAMERMQVFSAAVDGFELAHKGTTSYLNSLRDIEGNIVHPEGGVNLSSEISPKYGFIPAPIGNQFQWLISSGFYLEFPAVGICLASTGTVSPNVLKSLQAAQRKFPEGSMIQGHECNATVNSDEGGYLTYWVILDHISD